MIYQLALLLLASFAWCHPYPDTKPPPSGTQTLVSTPLGKIEGTIITSRLGKQILSFRGIRYAKPPVNELRFQPPVPADKWEGTYNATQDGAICPQPSSEPVSEDCLFLNVYTTKLGKETKRPVVVFIHGGGFHSLSGSSSYFGPQYFLDQEIVLVTFNYRLGPLGFLSTGDKEAVGNYGLKDQVQVLKWVKDNIEPFGGDPNSVTLAGHSAGAAAVTLHLVSPLSRGLFHRAIAMSGSSLGNWPVPTNQLDLAKKLAKFVNCPDDTSANIVKCLRSKSAAELGDSLPRFKEFIDEPVLVWLPVIEHDVGQPRFLPHHPVKLVQEGNFNKVPFLTGVSNDEFAPRAFTLLSNVTYIEQFNREFDKLAPIVFLYEQNTDNSKIVSKGLKTTYFNDKPIDKTQITKLAQLYSDAICGFAVNRAAKIIAEKNNLPVYYYKLSYQGRYSYFYTPDSNNSKPYGVIHGDDLIYLFYNKKLFPIFEATKPAEITMVEKMGKLWANFAKSGNPIPETKEKLDNVKWEPFTGKTLKYLDLGNKLVVQEKLNEKRYDEWDKLFPLSFYTKTKLSH